MTHPDRPPPGATASAWTVDGAAECLGIVGRSDAHRNLLRQLSKIADINAEVLITGPTGVGKELYARFLHEYGKRRARAFVAINCGAVPDHLFENELFGHQAGAYTGAHNASEGLVAAAEGGTLFLDEVDALTPPAQVKLLRLLQEKEYRRLGETRIRKIDVRFVAATNSDLAGKTDQGEFRQDLYFRLRVVPVQVLPLCNRPEDVAVLLLSFIERYSTQYGLAPITFAPRAWELLVCYHWPGNIRELENCIRGLTCQQLDRPIEPEDLPLFRDPMPGTTSNSILDESFQEAKRKAVERFERDYLVLILQRTGGNITEAARLAGKHRRAFFELLRKYNIDAAGYRMGPGSP